MTLQELKDRKYNTPKRTGPKLHKYVYADPTAVANLF